jgi:Domain of unknown function (DUF4337)
MVLKDKTGKILSRSEGEAVMKGRGAITISIMAALLAIGTLIANGVSSRVLTTTLKINDTYNFYQAKSIKQNLYEMAANDLKIQLDDTNTTPQSRAIAESKLADYTARIAQYESDPATGEGKRELMAKARQLEAERDTAKAKGPYFSFAGAALQIAIVLSSTAILAVSMEMLWASIGMGIIGAALLSNGIWSWFSLPWL